MDSDEEEMAALRLSSRHGGSRGPAASGQDAAAQISARPGGKQRQAEGEDDATRSAAASPMEDATEPDADDTEDLDLVEARGLFPVSFGKQKLAASGTEGALAHSRLGHRSGSAAASAQQEKRGCVLFGPRVSATAMAGTGGHIDRAQSRRVLGAGGAKDVQAAEQLGPCGEDSAEAEGASGEEDETLPVSHEVGIPAHDKAVTALALDPKGSRMVSGSMDGCIKFFDFNGMSEETNSFRCLEPVEGHMIQAVSFGTSGGCLLVVCSDSHARIYDREGSAKPIQSTVKGDMYVRDMTHTKGHTQMLTDGMWHPLLAEQWVTSSLDGTLRIWDINATPVGMDQVLPSLHVLKTLDRRNVCVGGGAGRAGGLYPCCCAYSTTDAKTVVCGCSDGSLQFFFEKARYQKPDRILRCAHAGPVSDVTFLSEGCQSNLLATRSLDNSMKVWDCRMIADNKGPLACFEGLPAGHEKAGLCTSPDGKYIVAGTPSHKAASDAATVCIFDAKQLTRKRTLSFGRRSGIRFAWPRELNQLIIGTSTGEIAMLYSPSLSKKGAMHFVGKKAKARPAAFGEGGGDGPVFNMTDREDIKRFYATGHGNMTRIRRQEARQAQRTLRPDAPPAHASAVGAQSDGSAFAAAVLRAGAQRLHLRSASGAEPDSQRALLAYAGRSEASPSLVDRAYRSTQPVKLLDWSAEVSEGDRRMQETQGGDFCRRCGQKVCRCVDYSRWGQANKKPRAS